MNSNENKKIEEKILSCLENVGIDAELLTDGNSDNFFSIMDSLQYISFIAEVEDSFNIELIDDFLIASSFNTLKEFVTKLEYYVKGWESFRNKYIMKEGECNETQKIEKDVV